MPTPLVALHGFTQNGARLQADLERLVSRLSAPELAVFPDAPNTCSEASVDRLYAAWGIPRQPPPYLCWWDATDDGSVYRGWEASYDRLRTIIQANEARDGHGRPGLLGFSQGAAFAAAIAALSVRGEFPPLAFVILVAGRPARADALRPLFESKVAVPSLHVWGERDPLSVPGSDALFEQFDPATREKLIWPGPHAVPTQGEASNRVVEFAERYGA